MQLTQAQLDEFDREGFLFFPSQFTPDEARALQAASQRVYDMHREEVWRESNGAARTAFAAHKYEDTMAALGAHPRLVNPVMQLVDGPVYMHQFKVNAKAAWTSARSTEVVHPVPVGGPVQPVVDVVDRAVGRRRRRAGAPRLNDRGATPGHRRNEIVGEPTGVGGVVST